jgi:hypothetical protein
MKISYQPRPKPATAGKKMQPPGNIGSDPTETSKKGKTSKTVVATEGVAKGTKAQDVLAKRKAELQRLLCPRLLKNLPSY